MVCTPEGGCWCAELPHLLQVPEGTAGCMCRRCLEEEVHPQDAIRSEAKPQAKIERNSSV